MRSPRRSSATLPRHHRWRVLAALSLLTLVPALTLPVALPAQTRVTTPKEHFGANFGDDYFLANYTGIAAYWRLLERQSPRMKVVPIGKTAEGREHLMAIVTSPENHRNLARYRDISARLAHAEGLNDSTARTLAREGKAVVWIDGGLHATETLGAQQLGETVYQMVSGTDDETRRLLEDVIILFVHANPDGNELVADWYMRDSVPARRTLAGLPRLYQKYIGHDNNREFFTSTQAETENINRVLYHEWFPQLLYNHHQSGPAGTVVYSPPFRDPYNYNLDPAMLLGIQALGTAMHSRLAIEGKPGATMRSGASYDGWWNGGIRNTATFHNTIAVLTEMIGSPTPMRIPLVAERQIPSGDLAMPIAPGPWHFRQSVDYSVSLNRAVLDHASRLREGLLFNIYRMGRNSIERGSRDTWTANPRRAAAVAARLRPTGGTGAGAAASAAGGGNAAPISDSALYAAQRTPNDRDPRGYIISANQPDFPTAVKFINSLRETGIAVHRARMPFSVNGKQYPEGSYIVKTAQAFRPHVIDMFEPQSHPDVFPFPGAPPTPPYDNAGWTLAFQMGVQFDRILDDFTGPFSPVTAWNETPPAGKVLSGKSAAGFLLSPQANDAFTVLNRLRAAGMAVGRIGDSAIVSGEVVPAGTFYVPNGPGVTVALANTVSSLGVDLRGAGRAPAGVRPVAPSRIGLWDSYGGSMPSGWTRWILEQFEFPFTRVFAPELDAGALRAKYDVLVFVTGAIPGARGGRGGGGAGAIEAPPGLPEEYRAQFGRITPDATIPKLREFVSEGGTLVAIGSSAANIAAALDLPVESHLVENGVPLPGTKFYVPGSVLSVRVDTRHPLAAGLAERTDVFFDDSPVFRLRPGAEAQGVRRVAWYDSPNPLRSGWAWGAKYLEGGLAAVEVPLGKGRVLLYGPEILQRAQPHGSFKFLFNALVRVQ